MSEGRTYGGESAAQRLARRRRQLLEAGLEVFGTTGYRAATVRMICREAKVADRYFYEQFENTEDLLLAVYAECIDRLAVAVAEAVAEVRPGPGGVDVEQMARRGLDAVLRTVEADPRLGRVVWFEVLGVSPAVESAYLDGLARFGEFIVAVLEATGELSEGPPATRSLVASAAVGGVSHVVMAWVNAGFEPPRDDLVGALARFLAGGGRAFLVPPTA